MLSGNPGATDDRVREAFEATALDLVPAGVDDRTGHGIIRADRVLELHGRDAAAARPRAAADVTPVDRRRRRLPRAGRDRHVALPVTNVGDGTATGISVTATTDDPLAVRHPAHRSYGDLAGGRDHARATSRSRWTTTSRSASASGSRCG